MVTNPYVSLSNTLLDSKPINSTITTSSGFPTAAPMLGKDSPVNEFTVGQQLMIGYRYWSMLPAGMAGQKMSH